MLVTLGATADEATAAYVRHGTLGLAQANQCFALTSFLVGKNYLAASDRATGELAGKSGIYAPLEMTPRMGGLLVEMGTSISEGLLTAELDREGLRSLWQSSAIVPRDRMPVDVFAATLPGLYATRLTLARATSDGLPATGPALLTAAPAAVEPGSQPAQEWPEPADLSLPGANKEPAVESEAAPGQLTPGEPAAGGSEDQARDVVDLAVPEEPAAGEEPAAFDSASWSAAEDAAPQDSPAGEPAARESEPEDREER